MNTQCDNYSCQPALTRRLIGIPAGVFVNSLASTIGRSGRLHLIRAELLARAVDAMNTPSAKPASNDQHGGACCDE